MGASHYDPDLMRGIGALLREIREEKGWTQYQVADMLNTSQAVVSDTEGGRRDMQMGTLQRFAKLYGQELEVSLVELPKEEES